MRLRPSLNFRLIAYLVPAQFLAITLGWVVLEGLQLSGLRSWTTKIDTLALGRTEDLLVESLVRGDDGTLRIEPTAALREEMRRVPTLKLGAYDPSRRILAPGSAVELTPLLVDPPAISLVNMNYFFVDDRQRLAVGVVDSISTAIGALRIAVYGERFRWDDPFLVLGNLFSSFLPYIMFLVLIGSAGTWLAVRRGLAPLRDVAADAAKIDVDELDQRLSESGVPTEILPLVGAFNDAVARLDASVGRLRRFTANAAHELRTPVTVLETRLDNFDVPTIKTDLRRDARRIRVLVEQLLATVRLARSDRPGTKVDLIVICQTVVDDLAMLAIRQRKAIKFQPQVDRLEIFGETRALESVVSNLVDNALRAEPVDGAVILRVGPNGLIEVVDHGPGIAKEERDVIFEPFWRKSEATPGAGLGLAIAKELTEALGGRIWVEETQGGGATFKLSFSPIAAPDPASQ